MLRNPVMPLELPLSVEDRTAANATDVACRAIGANPLIGEIVKGLVRLQNLLVCGPLFLR